MRKLNHDVKVGDRFLLNPSGWQCANVPHEEFEIVEMPEGYFDDCKIKQVNGDATYYIRLGNVEYFCGEEVEHEYGVAYDHEDYQPSGSDESDTDFITKEGDEFGFWYLGHRGSQEYISSTMLQTQFAWVKMPW